ncbi:MAG: tetraacyldisaccharide 4'-kinase [Cellvibrionaceae bacterium]
MWLSTLLLPLAWLFHLLIVMRRAYYRHLASPRALPCPVVVVGNINLGGSGKTPLLIALARYLRQAGYSPGVVSRGYGSSAPYYPFTVSEATSVVEAGDEPLMIAQQSACPVVIGSDRMAAARQLIEQNHCDVILSDDGLQHYRLPRDLEIVVIDGERLLGNNRLLPAGPLREPVARLQQVDWVVINGAMNNTKQALGVDGTIGMRLHPLGWRRVADSRFPSDTIAAGREPWWTKDGSKIKVHALAGIGNPQRFFDTLGELGSDFLAHGFPDHHDFQLNDIDFQDSLPVVMTEKDAVKCRPLLIHQPMLRERYWYLAVEARVDGDFFEALDLRLRALFAKREGGKQEGAKQEIQDSCRVSARAGK